MSCQHPGKIPQGGSSACDAEAGETAWMWPSPARCLHSLHVGTERSLPSPDIRAGAEAAALEWCSAWNWALHTQATESAGLEELGGILIWFSHAFNS